MRGSIPSHGCIRNYRCIPNYGWGRYHGCGHKQRGRRTLSPGLAPPGTLSFQTERSPVKHALSVSWKDPAEGHLGCSGAGSFALLSPPSASCLFPGKLIQFGCEKIGSDLLAIDPTLQERVLAPVRRWASHSSHQESRDMAYARGSLAAGGTALCFQAEGGSVYRLLP